MAREALLSREHAAALDAADPLARYRERFYLPHGRIYMDGNSLGAASMDAERTLLSALDQWKRLGVEAWTEGESPWFTLGERLGALQAALVGAQPEEVVITASTTVNLHALVASFYRPDRAGRRKIVADDTSFPSDVYALKSQIALKGGDPARELVLVPGSSNDLETALIEALGADAALLVVPSVIYTSGRLLDVERLAHAAHERGALIGVDACHSVGCVPHHFHEWGVDFAFWCTYKYLNGGPGAVASLYVHERHFGTPPALAGWWGSDKRRQFQMSPDFAPAAGAGAWQIGTPPILSAAAIEGALQVTLEAGIDAIREKSLRQTEYLIALTDELLRPHGFGVATPREPERRGGHVALTHQHAHAISLALRRRGIVPDFRPPNIVRLAPVALHTTYVELWDTVQALREIVATGEHLRVGAAALLVT